VKELRAFLVDVSNDVIWRMKIISACFPFVLLLLCSCSTFNYEWRQSTKQAVSTNDITGRWEGSWKSAANGHEDTLRCLITKVDEQTYKAKFHAAYKKWITFHFGYSVRLHAEKSADRIAFQGREDLGALAGGVYTYEGHADATNFFSTFKSKYDHGTFQMQRPAPPGTIPVYSAPEHR